MPLDEGYVFANVPFAKWDDDGQGWRVNRQKGVVVSHGCSCEDYITWLADGKTDKANKVNILVAPLISAADYPPDGVERIREGKYRDLFLIEGGDSMPAQVVQLPRQQAIPARVLVELSKIVILADWQWAHLQLHIGVFVFHKEPGDLYNPALLEETAGDAD